MLTFTFYILSSQRLHRQIRPVEILYYQWQPFTDFRFKQGTFPEPPLFPCVLEVWVLFYVIPLSWQHIIPASRQQPSVTRSVRVWRCDANRTPSSSGFSFEATCAILGRTPSLWIWSKVGRGTQQSAFSNIFYAVWQKMGWEKQAWVWQRQWADTIVFYLFCNHLRDSCKNMGWCS